MCSRARGNKKGRFGEEEVEVQVEVGGGRRVGRGGALQGPGLAQGRREGAGVLRQGAEGRQGACGARGEGRHGAGEGGRHGWGDGPARHTHHRGQPRSARTLKLYLCLGNVKTDLYIIYMC